MWRGVAGDWWCGRGFPRVWPGECVRGGRGGWRCEVWSGIRRGRRCGGRAEVRGGGVSEVYTPVVERLA